MFGSLVLVLPTPHEGGELIIRHNDKEWTFDSARALSEVSSNSEVHIGYAAFFSDVEHEVLPVKTGHRVTITCNLYFDDNGMKKGPEMSKTFPSYESDIKKALKALLEDSTFLPEGGRLAFGLNHEYPIQLEPVKIDFKGSENVVDTISKNLKGSDAVLMKIFKELMKCITMRLHI